jgi:dihydrofolate reductase
MKPISIIAAIAENSAIGKDNQLLWHLPEDLKKFKQITHGHTVVMGKKTFFSLPKRPLPGRKNVVLTTSPHNIHDDCQIVTSIDEALSQCDECSENFVIGGGSVYELFLPLASKLYITKVHSIFEADTFFPEIDSETWEIIDLEEHKADEKNVFDFTFVTYKRRG